MSATVMPPRHPSAGPCNSGTVPGGVSKPCGRLDTRPFAAGFRCPDHLPPTKAQLLAASA